LYLHPQVSIQGCSPYIPGGGGGAALGAGGAAGGAVVMSADPLSSPAASAAAFSFSKAFCVGEIYQVS